MMKEYLFNLIKKHQYNISIYTEDIFERRCQEEIIRSDEDNSSFVYIEFDFETIENTLGNETNAQQFWSIFMETLSKNKRGDDILGFLEHDSGIGLLLLDSKLGGWTRLVGRFKQTASSQNFEIIDLVLNTNVKPIVYPACIQDINKAQEAEQPIK
ncbi:MAG: hypothetical protein IJ905_05955 [Fibrobacter sp.]|jgi:hypothetical protein|nr:hypothetical protein [Fibrobacter sp.]